MRQSFLVISLLFWFSFSNSQDLTDYVNLYIGTANEGNTNPGAVMPWGMASISLFNCYDTLNPEAWCRSPYLYGRPYISGFTQLNISGTGCPDLGTATLMPTSGLLSFVPSHNTSTYSDAIATPGYYSVMLDKFGIMAEMTTTVRTTISRFTFPGGESNTALPTGTWHSLPSCLANRMTMIISWSDRCFTGITLTPKQIFCGPGIPMANGLSHLIPRAMAMNSRVM